MFVGLYLNFVVFSSSNIHLFISIEEGSKDVEDVLLANHQ